jgi:hypothetical protein
MRSRYGNYGMEAIGMMWQAISIQEGSIKNLKEMHTNVIDDAQKRQNVCVCVWGGGEEFVSLGKNQPTIMGMKM